MLINTRRPIKAIMCRFGKCPVDRGRTTVAPFVPWIPAGYAACVMCSLQELFQRRSLFSACIRPRRCHRLKPAPVELSTCLRPADQTTTPRMHTTIPIYIPRDHATKHLPAYNTLVWLLTDYANLFRQYRFFLQFTSWGILFKTWFYYGTYYRNSILYLKHCSVLT